MQDINEISRELGIPWEKSKNRAFASSNVYIRLELDLPAYTVAFAQEKVAKYQKAIEE